MLDAPVEIGYFPKNKRETIRVALRTFRGVAVCDIRVMVPGKDGTPVPTRRGISLPIMMVPALGRLILAALEELDRLGLLPPAGEP